MRIAYLSTFYPFRGGIAQFNANLLEAFAKEHTVKAFTFTRQYPAFLFPGKTQYVTPEDKAKPVDSEAVLDTANPFNWCKAARKIAAWKPDLVVMKYWMSYLAPSLGMVARRLRKRGIPTVAILDNVIPHEARFFDKPFSRWFLKQCSGCVAMSQSVLNDMLSLTPDKPYVLQAHPLYDHFGEKMDRQAAQEALGLDPKLRTLLFFGLIRDYKGLDLLIDAMADERLAQMGVRLIVAGEFYGDSKPYMEQLQRLGLGDRVVLHTDFIPDHEVNRYFCAADVVAQPYKSATQSGVSQIAYHFEKPMVVTRVGGLPEIVPDGKAGFVVEPEPKAIADALARFFKEGWAERLTDGVRDEKRKYGWDKMTAAINGE